MSNTSTTTPGLLIPQVQALPAGAGNTRDAAIQIAKNNSDYQTNLINVNKGGKKSRKTKKRKIIGKKRKYYGGFVVPQFTMNYKPVGAGGQTPNDVIKQTSTTSTSQSANKVYDGCVGKADCGASVGGNKKMHRKSKKKCYFNVKSRSYNGRYKYKSKKRHFI